jgi:spore coat polysaccharide biosynthesis protein SpsF
MNSTRLPGKVLKPLQGAPMLARQIERLSRSKLTDRIVVATTDRSEDDAIVNLLRTISGVYSYRGPEDDVLQRYIGAANEYEADVIVRVTADCPLIEPAVIDAAIESYLKHASTITYVTNCIVRTYPRGLDVEVFPLLALETAHSEAKSSADREHVTPFIWRQPKRFPRYDLVDNEDNSHLRWTVDTPEDFELIIKIYEALFPTQPAFNYRDALQLVRQHPNLSMINQHIQQKIT